MAYISTPDVNHSDAMNHLTKCKMRIRNWMACNCLKLNEKTQIIWLGTCQQLDKVQMLKLPNATVPFSSVVNDLGVVLDSQLTMANHVAALS